MADKPNLEGLDAFSRKYLSSTSADTEVLVSKGGPVEADKMQAAYAKQAKEDFIKRAGAFTEDLVAFIVDQKKLRNLDDKAVVFGLALANINLRNSFCSPQNREEQKEFDSKQKQQLETEWDEICWAAQCYYDKNT
jgi:hypothetical protein